MALHVYGFLIKRQISASTFNLTLISTSIVVIANCQGMEKGLHSSIRTKRYKFHFKIAAAKRVPYLLMKVSRELNFAAINNQKFLFRNMKAINIALLPHIRPL